jgi:hypothetical protein
VHVGHKTGRSESKAVHCLSNTKIDVTRKLRRKLSNLSEETMVSLEWKFTNCDRRVPAIQPLERGTSPRHHGHLSILMITSGKHGRTTATPAIGAL